MNTLVGSNREVARRGRKRSLSPITIKLESNTMIIHTRGADCILDYTPDVYKSISQYTWECINGFVYTRFRENGEKKVYSLTTFIFGKCQNGKKTKVEFVNGNNYDFRKENINFVEKKSRTCKSRTGENRTASPISIDLESNTMTIHAKGANCILDYDPDVYKNVSQYNWISESNGVLRTKFMKNGVLKSYSLVVILFGEYHNGEKTQVRFLNGNRHDFRKENLFFMQKGKFPYHSMPGNQRSPSPISIDLESGTMTIHAKGADCILDYDPDVYENVSQYNWVSVSKWNGVIRTQFVENGKNKQHSLAKILFEEKKIGFLNGNKCDFRKSNISFIEKKYFTGEEFKHSNFTKTSANCPCKRGVKRSPSPVSIDLESGTMTIHAKGADCILDYDPDVYENVSQYNWISESGKNRIIRTNFTENGIYKNHSLVDVIFGECRNGEKTRVGFLNGDRHDFRKENLYFESMQSHINGKNRD